MSQRPDHPKLYKQLADKCAPGSTTASGREPPRYHRARRNRGDADKAGHSLGTRRRRLGPRHRRGRGRSASVAVARVSDQRRAVVADPAYRLWLARLRLAAARDERPYWGNAGDSSPPRADRRRDRHKDACRHDACHPRTYREGFGRWTGYPGNLRACHDCSDFAGAVAVCRCANAARFTASCWRLERRVRPFCLVLWWRTCAAAPIRGCTSAPP